MAGKLEDRVRDIIVEQLAFKRILAARKMHCYGKHFTDKFRTELEHPEYDNDLDDIENNGHLRTVVEWADVLCEFFYLAHVKTPFPGTQIYKTGPAGLLKKQIFGSDQVGKPLMRK